MATNKSSPFRISMSFDGLSHVRAVLDTLGPKLESKVIVQSMRQAMKPVLAAAKSYAPVRSGALRRSLSIRTQRGKKRSKGIVRVGVVPGKRWFVGDQYYAGFVEFGFDKVPTYRVGNRILSRKPRSGESTEAVPAKPFLRPALDSNRDRVVSIFRREVQSRAAKYAATLARQKLAARDADG